MMYRVALRFIADAPRMAGRAKRWEGLTKAPRIIARGVWRVVECWETGAEKQHIFTADRLLYMVSPRPLVPHRLVNPRKVLAEYWAVLRAPGGDVIQSTREEKSAAFEWLRGFALGRSKDARHAGIMLSEVARLNTLVPRRQCMTDADAAAARGHTHGGDDAALRKDLQ